MAEVSPAGPGTSAQGSTSQQGPVQAEGSSSGDAGGLSSAAIPNQESDGALSAAVNQEAVDGSGGDGGGGDDVPGEGALNATSEEPSLRERFAFFRREALWGLDDLDDREDDSDDMSIDGNRNRLHVGHEKLQELLDADFPIKHRDNRLPAQDPARPLLTASDIDTLEYMHCWMSTGGTVDAFHTHAIPHRRKGTPIPSLHLAKKLITEQSDGLDFELYDMCPSSCVAFFGRYADLDKCPECNRKRYDRSGVRPRAQFRYIPLLPRLQAMYGDPDLSEQLRYRSERTEKAEERTSGETSTAHRFGDLHDGCEAIGWSRHCQDDRDCLVAITTDGSQLISNRKTSSCWMVLVQILNLPPTQRFAIKHHHFSLIVPGPAQPANLESFIWPLCAELAHLQETGAWTWDGAKNEWFLLRVLLAGVYADQKGSVKLSMHVGGNGAKGCRFCEIRAVFADNDGSSAYFPLRSMLGHTRRNRGRPTYDPWDLPHRTKEGYEEGILAVKGLRGRDLADVVRRTGMTELPLVAFSRLFGTPYFFPIDPFHLLHLNVPGNVWKAWKTVGDASAALRLSLGNPFGLSDLQRQALGLFVTENGVRYPSAFMSKAPRDIHRFGQTNYRAVEWAVVFHHFLPPFLYEIGAPLAVRELISTYVQAVDMSLSRDGLTVPDIATVRSKFVSFVKTWESMYAATDDGLKWMTISIHQLLHVADQLVAVGSVKATSQASCERYLGSIKKNLKQYRLPVRVVENRALQHTRMFILGLHHQELPAWMTMPEGYTAEEKRVEGLGTTIRGSTHRALTEAEKYAEKSALDQIPGVRLSTARYGRLKLNSGDTVRSKRVEPDELRCASNIAFVDRASQNKRFAEVIEFINVETTEGQWDTALIRLFNVTDSQPTFDVGQWTEDYGLVDVADITELVGVLRSGSYHYVIRKKVWQASQGIPEANGDGSVQAGGEFNGEGDNEDEDEDDDGGTSSDEEE
ncbi:hypothetical protein A4X13_0g2338 [Tilletia indica]|uniref:Transposase domain-containing protein n=1 Tax=Tilletia indica TaxID=43049 RepID=A0A8T8TA60_9BASI|nr:hypothetical protein A4X13_0g2338 [Tilletia indica]